MMWLIIMAMLWSNDPGHTYNQVSNSAPAYLSDAERIRWERLHVCRMLFEGNHRCYYLDEARSMFPFRPLIAQGRIIRLYVTINLLKLVSTKTADLMLAAKPKIDAPTSQQTQRLNDLARNSLVHPRLRVAAVQASWAGGAFLESVLWRGEPYLTTVNPDDLYPVGMLNPDGQYERYVRYATQDIGTKEQPKILLLQTTYEAGVIRRELYEIDSSGKRSSGQAELKLWPAFARQTPEPEQRTGLDRPTITYVPNFVDEKLEVSDYDGLISLQDSINAKRSQIERVLVLHADPKLWFDTSLAQPDGTVRAEDNVHYGPVKPEYITWEAQLEAAEKAYESTLMAFCAAAEMSPVGLGLMTGGQAAESAQKRRLDMTPDLAKAAQKALYFEPTIARAIETTQRLDQTSGMRRSYPVDPIAVHMQDGLPVDPLELSTEAMNWRSAGLLSIPAGVAMRIPDPEGAKIEIVQLEKENAAKVPTVFGPLGGSPDSTQGDTGTQGQEEGAQAA